MMLPSLEPGLVWSPPEIRWPNRLSASAWAPLPLEAAWALVLSTLTMPLTSAATAEESPGGAGVVVVTVLDVPDDVVKAATPNGTDMSGVRGSTTVARRTALRTCASPKAVFAAPGIARHLPPVTGRKQTVSHPLWAN